MMYWLFVSTMINLIKHTTGNEVIFFQVELHLIFSTCLFWNQGIEHFDRICFCIFLYLIVRRAGLLWSQQDFEWRWSVPLFKCLTVLEFSFILFDLCLLITFFNFIMNYVPFVTFWIFTYHKIWILSIILITLSRIIPFYISHLTNISDSNCTGWMQYEYLMKIV